jgi:hypothetical protein
MLRYNAFILAACLIAAIVVGWRILIVWVIVVVVLRVVRNMIFSDSQKPA